MLCFAAGFWMLTQPVFRRSRFSRIGVPKVEPENENICGVTNGGRGRTAGLASVLDTQHPQIGEIHCNYNVEFR